MPNFEMEKKSSIVVNAGKRFDRMTSAVQACMADAARLDKNCKRMYCSGMLDNRSQQLVYLEWLADIVVHPALSGEIDILLKRIG